MANVVSETLAVTGCLEARQVRSVGNVVSRTLAVTGCQEARQVRSVGNVVSGTLTARKPDKRGVWAMWCQEH